MEKIVLIGGPTASGKTDLAVKIAQKFNGELINADSRQIYKYLDIGTNKGDIKNIDGKNFIENIPIHLVSFLNPDQKYSVYEFKDAATALIQDILNRGKLPIIVGGTGLYIDSILKNYNLTESKDTEERAKLEAKNLDELTNYLISNFNNAYENLTESDKLNKRRLVRLIEKCRQDVNPTQNSEPVYHSLFLYPEYNWIELSKKIEDRVEQMFENGFVEEVKNVLSLGYPKDSVALQGAGYKEVIRLLDNKIDLQNCVELVKISHRQYARRQRTWFEGKGRHYNLVKVSGIDAAEKIVKDFYGPEIKNRGTSS